jgi:thymidylate synthase (FAD)
MKVKAIAKTVIINEDIIKELQSNSSDQLIMYCARVSNPENQLSGKPGLLKYCADNGHVSIFEQADLTVEIETSRAIAAQILRHRSFTFQEFSQRYAKVQGFEQYEARRQDTKNRQNSIDDMSKEDKDWFEKAQEAVQTHSGLLYEEALRRGVAKEQARFLLPLNTKTKLYMKGPVRSWVHYINLRTGNGTQKEHQDIANEIKKIFIKEFPIVAQALNWTDSK